MTDLIARIDALTTATCGHCGRPLPADGPSGDFCGEMCASTWRARQAEPLVPAETAPHRSATGGPVGSIPPLPIYILALNYRLAEWAAVHTLCVRSNQWRYVSDAYRLRGLDAGRYYLDESFGRRADADGIRAVLASRRMTSIAVPELNALDWVNAADGSWDVTDQRPPWRTT